MRHFTRTYLIALGLAPALLSAQSRNDYVMRNARIYTVDETKPFATAMVVRGDRIVFVGSDREALALAGKTTKVWDMRGWTILPGFADAHIHVLGVGESLRDVDLVGSKSIEEVVAKVVARSRGLKAGEWIIGRGWDQNLFPSREFPSHDALSRALPNNPVVLTRIDGHALLANAKAMALAGITSRTADPVGGRIVRDAGGNPTGVFVDNAKSLVARAIPNSTHEELRKSLLSAIGNLNSWGLTSAQDPGEGPTVTGIYEELARAGQLNVRSYVMLSDPDVSDSASWARSKNPFIRRGPQSALYNGHLWIRAIKLYADGAMGSRGAALLAPYSDDPGNSGLLVSTPAHIRGTAEMALRKGFQVNVHAIGDRGNRIVLDAFDSALKKFPTANHRFRIEHAQTLSPSDIPRFAQLGVIPSMQSSHQTSDMGWIERRLGPVRVRGAYAWRSLLETGVIIPNGTDAPVERVNPFITFHSAVTRQSPDNQPAGGWYPAQRMTREEALKSMTIWPAYAAFQEKILGSLTPGKYADFVVLDQDIMRVPAEDIMKTGVIATYVGGRSVYQSPNEFVGCCDRVPEAAIPPASKK
jgi:predicted amidohydrolase YtcJ